MASGKLDIKSVRHTGELGGAHRTGVKKNRTHPFKPHNKRWELLIIVVACAANMVFTLLDATAVMLEDNALESWRLGVGFILANSLCTTEEIGIHC